MKNEELRMKNTPALCRLRFCCLVTLLLFCFNVKSQNDLVEIKEFGSNPGNLRMFVYNPDSSKTGHAKLPLVVALHGCTQTAATMADVSGWNELAKRYHFMVIYPQQRFLNNPSGCFNWFEKSSITKDHGEVFSIKQMVDYALKTYSLDSANIFVYGLSAGAAMGVALITDYPYMFKAGAILAGGPYPATNDAFDEFSAMSNPKSIPSKVLENTVREQNPNYKGNYPSLIIFHGEEDDLVNIKNSYLLTKQWAGLVHTDTIPTKIDSSFNGNRDFTRKAYCDNQHQSNIIFYEVANLGHALPVFPGDSVYQGGHTGLFSVNKHFFSTYWIAKDFGLIIDK